MRMKHFIVIIITILITNLCYGQNTFIVKNGSANYIVSINVKCKNGECGGIGTLKLVDKKTKQVLQVITSNDLNISLDLAHIKNSRNNELNADEIPVIFGDFNFDGKEDIAVRNGTNSGYNGPSYDVYLYEKASKRFSLNAELTKMATENLGMFDVDTKSKHLVAYQKDGCCWHVTKTYAYLPNKSLQKIEELQEDGQDETYTTISKNVLVNGKWVKSVRKVKKTS
jgi:hypothetical protein